jgi:SAM-dependent methyltransferase
MALFDVAADAYVQFMGRFSAPLSAPFAEIALARVGASDRVLDVGCGPGILTFELVKRQGETNVSAVDPVEGFVQATASSYPAADVRRATAEDLPFPDDTFGATLAQLVVHFMSDPVGGLREMRRVTRPGGTVAASVWDHGGGRGPLSPFWEGVHDVFSQARDESGLAGSRQGQLGELSRAAGVRDVEEDELTVAVRYSSFEEWWEPFTFGVGPAGDYVAGLDTAQQ